VFLKDIASTSIFFFLDPQYESLEATSMIKSLDKPGLQQFGTSLTFFLP
jgi:hypothetical protein